MVTMTCVTCGYWMATIDDQCEACYMDLQRIQGTVTPNRWLRGVQGNLEGNAAVLRVGFL